MLILYYDRITIVSFEYYRFFVIETCYFWLPNEKNHLKCCQIDKRNLFFSQYARHMFPMINRNRGQASWLITISDHGLSANQSTGLPVRLLLAEYWCINIVVEFDDLKVILRDLSPEFMYFYVKQSRLNNLINVHDLL